MNRVQVVLSGFSMRLFCFVQAKTLCRYGYIYFWLWTYNTQSSPEMETHTPLSGTRTLMTTEDN